MFENRGNPESGGTFFGSPSDRLDLSMGRRPSRLVTDGGIEIPEQLQDYPLIRVCRPNCRSHNNCNHPGKRPVTSTKDPDPINRIQSWINEGGNYGVVAKPSNDLVLVDADREDAIEAVEEFPIPETFTIKTGGGGRCYVYRCRKFNKQTSYREDDEEIASIRAKNWHAVGPGSRHESGNKYEILKDEPIQRLLEIDLNELMETFDELEGEEGKEGRSVQSGGPAAPSAQASPPSRSSAPSPSSRSSRLADSDGPLSFIVSDEYRSKVAHHLLNPSTGHNDRIWLASFLYGAVGLSESEIVDLIMDHARWDNLDREKTERHVRSVIRSNRSGQGDRSTAYKPESERRKTEGTTEVNTLVNIEILEQFDMVVVAANNGNDDDQAYYRTALKQGEHGRFYSLDRGGFSNTIDPDTGKKDGGLSPNEPNRFMTLPEDPDQMREVADLIYDTADEIESEE